MYTSTFPGNVFFQGDILKAGNFLFPLPGNQKPKCVAGTLPHNSFFGSNSHIYHAAQYSSNCAIITQNCDIDNREFILISPVFPINNNNTGKHIIDLRQQKVNYKLHLPKTSGLPESYIDLQVINAIKLANIKITNRIAVMSDYGRALLQDKLRYYLGRVEVKPYLEFE